MDPVTLRTDRLVLDLPGSRPDDVDRVAEYCADPVFERFMTTPWPYTRADALWFVERFVPAGWRFANEFTWAIRWADDPDGALLGVVGARTARGDIGYWLGAPHRGHGVMTEAAGAVVDWRFAGGAETVAWEAIVGNTASARVARALGFACTGVGPAGVPARDGTRPESWHGVLGRDDPREPRADWPEAAS